MRLGNLTITHTYLGSDSRAVCERHVGGLDVLCESCAKREQVESAPSGLGKGMDGSFGINAKIHSPASYNWFGLEFSSGKFQMVI
jgi:hypothetical protein